MKKDNSNKEEVEFRGYDFISANRKVARNSYGVFLKLERL